MAPTAVYQSGAWHEFYESKNLWLGADPAMVIIPEHEDKRHVAKAFPDLKISVFFTIPELIARYIKNRYGKGLISPHGLESILSSIIIGEGFAPYLKIEKYKQSYVKVLADFIDNFRKTSLADLQAAIADFKADRLTFKEKDLVKIYTEYEKRLPGYGFDLKSGLEELVRRTNAADLLDHLGLRENERVIVLGFDYITPLEEEFIFTVFNNAPRVSFLFSADAAASEQATRVQKSIAALLERLQDRAVEYVTLPLQEDDFFTVLARALFKPDRPVGLHMQKDAASPAPHGSDTAADSNKHFAAPEPRGKITISTANSRCSEVVSIARRIRHLAEAGVLFSEMRVVAPAYHLYGAIIREVFPEYGVPFCLEKGVPLLRFPLAVVILHLAQQGTSPNPYPLREKILSSPYISYSAEVKPRDLVIFQETGGVALLPGERLNLLLNPATRCRLDFNYIRNMRGEAYRTVKPAPGIPTLEVVKRYLEGMARENTAEREEHLCRCLVQFYLLARAEKELSAWQARMSGTEFREALLELLRRFQVADNCEFSGNTGGSAMESRIRERDLAILGQVEKLLAELVFSLAPPVESAAEKFALVELVRIFSRLMSESSLFLEELPPAGESGRVSIQPVNRGQYQKWEYSFICGMVDGELPAAEQYNFLQPKKEGLGLGHAYTSVDHGRNRFYHLVRSTAKALFLSRPLADNGRRLPPSPLIKEMQRRAGAAVSPAGSGPPAGGGDQVYSRREKLFLIGKNVDRDYDKALPLLQDLQREDEALFKKITAILRFDGLTLNTASFSEFDGLFPHALAAGAGAGGADAPATPSAALLAEKIRGITFTPAVLERYAACPMRFFFDDILGLKQEPDYHPDTAEEGLLIRSMLKEYTAAACAARDIPEGAPELLQKLVDRRLQEQEQSGADAFQLRFMSGLSAGLDGRAVRRPGLLRAFLDYEENGPDYLRPYWAEIAGTVTLQDELEIRVEPDRVDLTAAGDYLLPYFYTAAPAGDPGRISRGLRFDLPLAVLLCKNRAAEQQVGIPVAGAGLYLVKNPKGLRRGGYFALAEIRAARRENTSPEKPVFSGQREGFMNREEFAAALVKIKNHILRLQRLMKGGVFHLPLCLEAEQTCDHCSFGRICRKEQLRLERLKLNIAHDLAGADKVNLVSKIF